MGHCQPQAHLLPTASDGCGQGREDPQAQAWGNFVQKHGLYTRHIHPHADPELTGNHTEEPSVGFTPTVGSWCGMQIRLRKESQHDTGGDTGRRPRAGSQKRDQRQAAEDTTAPPHTSSPITGAAVWRVQGSPLRGKKERTIAPHMGPRRKSDPYGQVCESN